MGNLIGRKKEIEELSELYNSNKAEFVAIYGRRRIGKTFLVDEALKGKITFRHAGLSPVDEANEKNSLKNQLRHFYLSLQLQGMKRSKCPTTWMEAFFMLSHFWRAKTMAQDKSYFSMNCLGWTLLVRDLSRHSKDFGTHGLAIETTSCSYVAEVPIHGCSTIS